jgi:AraC-like DNA-binding protein
MRPRTLSEQRRLYLRVRLVLERHYARRITIPVVARALATSPRQIQRAYAQFGDLTFREDLAARRLAAAAELLAQPAIPISDVAQLVGYRQASHFSKAFRTRYAIPPARFRRELLGVAPTARVMLRGDARRLPESAVGPPAAGPRR